MKTAYIRPLFIIVCLLFALRFANAQGCRLDYTPEYSAYDSEASDGTNIYTSVVVDGSTVGEPSAGCNETSAIHTPKAYNVIGSTGGWLTGSSVYMTSYVELENQQQLVATPGVTYTFSDEAEVICSVFGVFYTFVDNVGVGLHRASYAATPGAGNSCNFNLSCPAGQTAVCGTASYNSGAGNACQAPYLNVLFLGITKGSTKSCYGVGPNVWSATQGSCD